MRVLSLTPLLALLLGCGGDKASDSSDATGAFASCTPKGALSGCLLYEGTDCTDNSALDGLPGGWFNDDGGELVIGFATTDDGLDIRLTVPDASGVGDGSEYDIPTEVLVELTSKDGTGYYACAGTLRITNYTKGDLLWATATLQARGPMGLCGETDFYTVGAELVNAEYCGG